MQLKRLSNIGGVEVRGVDLGVPRTAEEDRKLTQLYDEYGLVVFRDQKLTKQQLVDAGRPFGGTALTRAAVSMDSDVPGVSTLSTRGTTGDVMPKAPDERIGHSDWHTDDGYVTAPTRGKILYAVQVPEEGGITGFIDGTTIYNEMPESLRQRVEGLHVLQDWNKVQIYLANARRYAADGEAVLTLNKFPLMSYPIVYPHPISGAKVLNCPPLWTTGIEELPGKEGDDLLAELTAYATQEKFQYWHKYNVGDAMLWDNWRFMHAASGTLGRYVRTMWTVTLNSSATIAREAARQAA